MREFGFPIIDADLRTPPPPAEAAALAAALRAGAVLDARVVDDPAAVVDEIISLQASRFDPSRRHFTEILVAERAASLGWGTDDAHGIDPIALAERCPRLAGVCAAADALDRALRPAGDRLLLSITPSMRKARSFPRFYHQDSPCRPHCYEMVWDIGLERPGEVLDVHFVPRAAFEDGDGVRAAKWGALFQQAEFVDHYALSDAQIDARQRQVRGETLPSPSTTRLRPGRALIWIDALFYHTTWLRHGRALTELEADPRSIVILRAVRGHRGPALPTDAELSALLGHTDRATPLSYT